MKFLKIGFVISIFVAFLLTFFFFNKKEETVLRILTYSSFAGIYGPGRKLQKEFESHCRCRIEWILAEDSTRMFQRLELKIPVDVVLGFDQIIIEEFKDYKWNPLRFEFDDFVSQVSFYKNKYFIPIDWSPIGFIYKDSKIKMSHDLKNDLFLFKQISFPEPRASTLGLQFYYWIYHSFKGNIPSIKGFLKKIKSRVYGPIFSWSLSYGFFQKGHVETSLSYLTSLAYHKKENVDYHFLYSEKGHPYQVEMAGIPITCSRCRLANDFLQFLLQEKAQKIIMNSHYMFPVVKRIIESPFSSLKIPLLISYKDLPQFLKQKHKLFKIWNDSLY